MGGAVTTDSSSVNGSLGTAAAGYAPGSRISSATWTDKNGNLWLFGGMGFEAGPGNGYLNDLWKLSPSTDQWAWIGGPEDKANQPGIYGARGTAAPDNIPGARSGAITWTDANGNLWLFGGSIYTPNGLFEYFNDLWEYSPSANEWRWISGSDTPNQAGIYGALGAPVAANMPGARQGAVGWIDSKGILWLFGGYGYDSAGALGGLNDLWEFNPSTGMWTWVNGPDTANQPAVPGTAGVPAAGNVPSARPYDASWIDKNGNFWIFGGDGLNDLWKYNPTTKEWAWISGVTSYTVSTIYPGSWGTFETPAVSNIPSGRVGSFSWTDAAGHFWLFGGVGADATGYESFLNDLWEFNPTTNEWAWMGGSSVGEGVCPVTADWCGQIPVYGTLQTPGLGVIPGGRYDDVGWTDSKGNFWLFGGVGIDQAGNGGYLNDLWEFQPNTGGEPVTATPTLSLASGTYASWQTLTISDSTPGATIHYVIDGSPPDAEYTGPLTISSSQSVEAIASASGYANSNTAVGSYTLNLPVTAAPTFTVPAGSYATTQSVAILDATPGATIYYAIGGVPPGAFSVYSGPISVAASEKIEAFAVADNYASSAVATAQYNIGSLPATSALWTWMNGTSALASTCYSGAGVLISCSRPGWYGTLGTPAVGNNPGGRGAAAGWTDSSGNLWIFGGNGYDGAGTEGLLNDMWKYDPSTSEWSWMGGSEIIGDSCPAQVAGEYCGKPGIYGTQGVPSPENIPGGRQWATSWTDKNGHFWLYGGEGFDANGVLGYLDDLWEFDPSTNEWTWMGGHSTVAGLFAYYPGIYGTQGSASPQNWPGTRWYTTSWTDSSGHLWMYGGHGSGMVGVTGYLNDLWEYDPSTNEWTWRNGLQFAPNPEAGWPADDSLSGVPAPYISPESRSESQGWADSSGHLWLFAGYNVNLKGIASLEDDQWEFDPSINEWTMIGGGGGSPVYGTLGTPAPGNVPASCAACPSWTDNKGNFWLLGGSSNPYGFGPAGNTRDLWWFSPSTDEWTWMGGTTSQQGIYGTLGVPAAGDSPSARSFAVAWTGKDGNLWLFGGGGDDGNNGAGAMNDMWEYGLSGPPSTSPPKTAATPTFSLVAGTYGAWQSLTLSDTTPGEKIYYTTDGTTPSAYSSVYTGQITVMSSETIQAVAVADGYVNSQPVAVSYVINLPAAATPTFSVSAGTYTSAQTVTISDTTAGATIYYTTDGTTPTTSSPVYSSTITVSATETIKAIAVASGYAISAIASATYTIKPPPSFTLAASPGSLTLNPGGQDSVTLTVTPQNGFNSAVSFACSGLPSGTNCSFSPSAVTPAGSAATDKLTISVSTQASVHSDGRGLFPAMALAGVLCLFSWRRRRTVLFLVLLVAASLGLLTGCGGGGGGSSPQPVNATVTVTGTSGTLQSTTTIALTVN